MAASHTWARKTLPAWATRQRSLISEGPAREERTRKMSHILIVDQHRRPLMPTTPARARLLLKQHKAAILRRFPLVLILKEARPEASVRLLSGRRRPAGN